MDNDKQEHELQWLVADYLRHACDAPDVADLFEAQHTTPRVLDVARVEAQLARGEFDAACAALARHSARGAPLAADALAARFAARKQQLAEALAACDAAGVPGGAAALFDARLGWAAGAFPASHAELARALVAPRGQWRALSELAIYQRAEEPRDLRERVAAAACRRLRKAIDAEPLVAARAPNVPRGRLARLAQDALRWQFKGAPPAGASLLDERAGGERRGASALPVSGDVVNGGKAPMLELSSDEESDAATKKRPAASRKKAAGKSTARSRRGAAQRRASVQMLVGSEELASASDDGAGDAADDDSEPFVPPEEEDDEAEPEPEFVKPAPVVKSKRRSAPSSAPRQRASSVEARARAEGAPSTKKRAARSQSVVAQQRKRSSTNASKAPSVEASEESTGQKSSTNGASTPLVVANQDAFAREPQLMRHKVRGTVNSVTFGPGGGKMAPLLVTTSAQYVYLYSSLDSKKPVQVRVPIKGTVVSAFFGPAMTGQFAVHVKPAHNEGELCIFRLKTNGQAELCGDSIELNFAPASLCSTELKPFRVLCGGVSKEVSLAVTYLFDVSTPNELRNLPLDDDDAQMGAVTCVAASSLHDQDVVLIGGRKRLGSTKDGLLLVHVLEPGGIRRVDERSYSLRTDFVPLVITFETDFQAFLASRSALYTMTLLGAAKGARLTRVVRFDSNHLLATGKAFGAVCNDRLAYMSGDVLLSVPVGGGGKKLTHVSKAARSRLTAAVTHGAVAVARTDESEVQVIVGDASGKRSTFLRLIDGLSDDVRAYRRGDADGGVSKDKEELVTRSDSADELEAKRAAESKKKETKKAAADDESDKKKKKKRKAGAGDAGASSSTGAATATKKAKVAKGGDKAKNGAVAAAADGAANDDEDELARKARDRVESLAGEKDKRMADMLKQLPKDSKDFTVDDLHHLELKSGLESVSMLASTADGVSFAAVDAAKKTVSYTHFEGQKLRHAIVAEKWAAPKVQQVGGFSRDIDERLKEGDQSAVVALHTEQWRRFPDLIRLASDGIHRRQYAQELATERDGKSSELPHAERVTANGKAFETIEAEVEAKFSAEDDAAARQRTHEVLRSGDIAAALGAERVHVLLGGEARSVEATGSDGATSRIDYLGALNSAVQTMLTLGVGSGVGVAHDGTVAYAIGMQHRRDEPSRGRSVACKAIDVSTTSAEVLTRLMLLELVPQTADESFAAVELRELPLQHESAAHSALPPAEVRRYALSKKFTKFVAAGNALRADISFAPRSEQIVLCLVADKRALVIRGNGEVGALAGNKDEGAIVDACFSTLADFLLVAFESGVVAIYSTFTVARIASIKLPALTCVAPHPKSSSFFFAGCRDGTVHVIGPRSSNWAET